MKTFKPLSYIIGSLKFIPYFRHIHYTRMINDICDESECKKIINFYDSIPLETRINLFKKSFEFTKPD
jgi:hypothetical protein